MAKIQGGIFSILESGLHQLKLDCFFAVYKMS